MQHAALAILLSLWSAETACAMPNSESGIAWPVQGELHLSVLSDLADRSALAGSFGYAARFGPRWANWGIFAHVEHDLWLATEFESDVVAGAVNLAIGGEHLYYGRGVRTSLALGASILAYDAALDKAGNVGLFVDFRPVGLRFPLTHALSLGLDPLTLTIVAPVLTGVALVQVEYRTAVYLEVSL
ncbi:MAG: hypothetical protein OEZ06_07470 [Myxococcales bacterium]|nr:hypothetical protein [Myxococcales bacterium]